MEDYEKKKMFIAVNIAAKLKLYLMIIGWYLILFGLDDCTGCSQNNFMKGGTDSPSQPVNNDMKSWWTNVF